MKFNKPEIMTKFATKVSTKLGVTALKVKKHAPEICLVTGLVSGAVTTVLACKATLKLDEVLGETQATVDAIHETAADEAMAEKYTPEDAKKDLTITYVQTGVKIAKLYAPAVAMGALSVTCILASHNMMKKRNVALAAAYATIDQTFKDYRGRVVERFGEKVDQELRYDIKAKKVEEKTVDPETGKEKKTKGIVEVAGLDPNGYSRFFDKSCYGWENNRDYNLMFLKAQQNHFNDLLTARGYVFLNDIYDALGIERTKDGQIVGWVEENPNADISDGFVDFGIMETNIETDDGYAPAILLDFNVDGNILDLI